MCDMKLNSYVIDAAFIYNVPVKQVTKDMVDHAACVLIIYYSGDNNPNVKKAVEKFHLN